MVVLRICLCTLLDRVQLNLSTASLLVFVAFIRVGRGAGSLDTHSFLDLPSSVSKKQAGKVSQNGTFFCAFQVASNIFSHTSFSVLSDIQVKANSAFLLMLKWTLKVILCLGICPTIHWKYLPSSVYTSGQPELVSMNLGSELGNASGLELVESKALAWLMSCSRKFLALAGEVSSLGSKL